MKKLFFFLLIACFFPALAKSQFQQLLMDYSDSLSMTAAKVLNAPSEQERIEANKKVLSAMRELLQYDSSFYHTFHELPTIAKLRSGDGKVRILNWNLPKDNGKHLYYAFIQYLPEKGDYRYFELKDIDSSFQHLLNFRGGIDQWPGALYYKIIERKSEFKDYYSLIGWDGNNRLSTIKVLDVLSFDKRGNPYFGEAIFQKKNQLQHRVIFEYASTNKMKLNYREDLDLILFDHLSPPKSSLIGLYEYYGPDFSFDAYKWEKNKWILVEDVDPDKGLKKKASYFRPEGKDTIRSNQFKRE